MTQSYLTQVNNTIRIRWWSFWNVPLLYHVKPWVTELNNNKTVLSIKLRRQTRNHFHSLYMGVLVAGADLASGLLAMTLVKQSGHHLSIIFKDMKANFIQRAESRTIFVCEDSELITKMIQKAITTHIRVNQSVTVTAFCPDISTKKAVATFSLTLSLKKT